MSARAGPGPARPGPTIPGRSRAHPRDLPVSSVDQCVRRPDRAADGTRSFPLQGYGAVTLRRHDESGHRRFTEAVRGNARRDLRQVRSVANRHPSGCDFHKGRGSVVRPPPTHCPLTRGAAARRGCGSCPQMYGWKKRGHRLRRLPSDCPSGELKRNAARSAIAGPLGDLRGGRGRLHRRRSDR